MESQIQHFAHPDHPLILIDLKDTKMRDLIETHRKINPEKVRYRNIYSKQKDVGIFCDFCIHEMLESAYSCISCDFHLHVLCAKLPTQMLHPHHTEHPLTLIRSNYKDKVFICNICSEHKLGFGYNCHSCKFDVDVRCAAESQVINHEGHLHPLRPFLRTALFECNACATEHPAGVSYKCSTCPFWVHEDCATLPTTVKYHRHVHPLSLVFPNRRPYQVYGGCNICRELIMQQHGWYYECGGCIHRAHANCLATTLIAQRRSTDENEADDIDLTKLFHLPESFQHDDLVVQMIKHMTTHYGNYRMKTVVLEDGTLSHFRHKHPLTLCNVERAELNSYSDDERKMKMKSDIICNACMLPVSTENYYSCTICNNFVLHEWCAKLPNELQHPTQPLVTFLLQEPGQTESGISVCYSSDSLSNGYVYRSVEDEGEEDDGYVMDIKCLCLPPTISHKAHQHPLKLQRICFYEGCVACPRVDVGMAYGCDKCCFYLHYRCALQPITIVHRYDIHPFVLVDAPIEDGPDEYVCEFCEEDIDPKWWFYHCLLCDQSACVGCIFGVRKLYLHPRITYSSKVHNHPLAFVEVDSANKTSLCPRCQKNFCNLEYALQCARCNLMFHYEDCTMTTRYKRAIALVQEEPR